MTTVAILAGNTLTPTYTKKPVAPQTPAIPAWSPADMLGTMMMPTAPAAPATIQPFDLSMKRLGLPDITKTSFADVSQQEASIKTANDLAAGLKMSASGSTKGMNPGFAAALAKANAAMKAAGLGTFSISSGFRTYDQQVALYKKYLAGKGNLAAKPGSSWHEKGTAVDLNWSQLNNKQREWLRANLPKYGIKPPSWDFHYKKEPWHWTWAGE